MYIDFELELLKQLVPVFDQHLETMYQRAAQEDDLDSFGYFDGAEHIVGLGFVACQTYISSVCGFFRIEKQKALSQGPVHSSKQTKVQIINSAANYWKHNSEWSLEGRDKQRRHIEEIFELVGFPVDSEYPLCGILTEVAWPEQPFFAPVITLLEQWRDDIQRIAG